MSIICFDITETLSVLWIEYSVELLMPDKRKHRGHHPVDKKLFSRENIPTLKSAVQDYSLLLTKGYPEKGSLKLVGDKFSLTKRQRIAVMRCACSDSQLNSRKQRQSSFEQITGKAVIIDGYNTLITIESALAGAVIFKSRDETYKDMASIHGTYRKIEETIPAAELIGNFLSEKGIRQITWLLDKPVSNSGRLKKILQELAERKGWDWKLQLEYNPDEILKEGTLPVISSDSAVLDKCKTWINLAEELIKTRIPETWLIDLSDNTHLNR